MHKYQAPLSGAHDVSIDCCISVLEMDHLTTTRVVLVLGQKWSRFGWAAFFLSVVGTHPEYKGKILHSRSYC
jgi:hypothetical protein